MIYFLVGAEVAAAGAGGTTGAAVHWPTLFTFVTELFVGLNEP